MSHVLKIGPHGLLTLYPNHCLVVSKGDKIEDEDGKPVGFVIECPINLFGGVIRFQPLTFPDWPPQMTSLKIGDTVQVLPDGLSYDNEHWAGRLCRVLEVGAVGPGLAPSETWVKLEYEPDGSQLWLLDHQCELVGQPEPTGCVCTLMDLMTAGCKCGQMERERA